MNRWEDLAACSGLGTDLFFMEKGASDTAVAAAKAVCARCPVRGACLDFALDHRTIGRFGVWGGTTEKDRRRILRQRRLAIQHDAVTEEQAA